MGFALDRIQGHIARRALDVAENAAGWVGEGDRARIMVTSAAVAWRLGFEHGQIDAWQPTDAYQAAVAALATDYPAIQIAAADDAAGQAIANATLADTVSSAAYADGHQCGENPLRLVDK